MKPHQLKRTNNKTWQVILLGFFAFIACGIPVNFQEALDYIDETSNTVALLSSYESDLRAITDVLSEGKHSQNWFQDIKKIKGELDVILEQENKSWGEWDQKNKMKLQLINWVNSLILAAEEGLKENSNRTQKALNIYHYLDIAGELGRITRSERELMIGHYRGLH